MSEVKHHEIVYEDGWRESAPAAKEQTPAGEEQPAPEKPPETPDGSKPLLITVQLALCLLAALALFLLKTMDSDWYRGFMAYYHEEMQKPIVSQDVFKAVDLGALFSENAVTVQATPDETARSED